MRFTKAIVPLALCIMLLSLAVPAQKYKGRAAKPRDPIVVAPIDTNELKGLLTQQREHPLLVNFWATFCDPCRDEFPDLVKINKDYDWKSLEFFTVSLDDVAEIKGEVPKFLDSMEATIRGGTHYEFSFIPGNTLPYPLGTATLRGMDMVAWYTTAWLDRYVKCGKDATCQRRADARLLTNRWRNTRAQWDDAQAENFEQTYLRNLESDLKVAASAMDQMAVLINQAKRDCE